MNGEEKNLAVAIIPVDLKLNLKLAAKAAKAKKAEMAKPDIAEKTTGYVVGGSVLSVRKKHYRPLFIKVRKRKRRFVSVPVSVAWKLNYHRKI